MKFVDEVKIRIEAGKGGHGCLSFRREKFIPLGGPDGGDGGDGGSVYLRASAHVNTLVDYRYNRTHKAQNGRPGSGRLRRGKSGEDLTLDVPIGTMVYDLETDEFIGDLTEEDQVICVARGGFHGLGNARYKSSTNRAPRQISQGTLGEHRELRLELKVLADVGLLGLPNAGKSTFIRSVSNATPKVAGYPFTTLHPHLGVVRVGEFQSFVVADIPGLIEGASEGVGLGIRFLKHLARTGLLLHMVDIAAVDGTDPVLAITSILKELEVFSAELIEKPRWLVFTKTDLLPEEECEVRCQEVLKAIGWQGPVFRISSVSHVGTKMLCAKVMGFLESGNIST